MKIQVIVESWRRFLKENKSQYITLDESQITPDFLKFNLSEKILTEEKDPQALTIEELEEKPAEFYKQQLAAMRDIEENTKKVDQRIENDRQLKIAFTDAKLDVEDLQYSIETDQLGTVTDFYNWSVGIINSIFGTEVEDSAKELKNLESKKEEIAKKIRDILITTYNPFQREIFRAISVFTGGNFDQIRDPKTFDPTKAKVFNMVNDGIRDIFMPTRETFKKAKVILRKLAGSEIKPVETWRGYGIDEKSGKYPGLEAYKIGEIIDVPNLSSFSIEKEVAVNFALDNGPEKGRWGIIFYVPKTYRGVDVDFLSAFEGGEKEIISFGKFKITKMVYENRDQGISVPFSNLVDLKGKPNYSEEWKLNGLIEVSVEMIKE